MRLRGTLACAVVALCTACAAPREKPASTPQVPAEAAPADVPARVPAASPATSAAPAKRPPSEDSPPPVPAAPATAPAVPAPDAPAPAGSLADGQAVFAALRAQLASDGCSDDRVVGRWIGRYARAPHLLSAQLSRVLPLLAYVVERVRDAGLPGEFALIPIVESWYRPDARHAGTAGLWQFGAPTARSYGLRVDATRDQRLEPGPATDAALAYLADLLARFGDWRLAVMAYNAGEYRLAGAHAADPSAPSPGGHRPRGLGMVTYEHLAKLQALACLVHAPQRAGLELPEAAFAALGRDALRPAASGLAQQPYVVRAGDSLWAIARRHGVALADLLRWNRLDPDAVLRPGQLIRLTP